MTLESNRTRQRESSEVRSEERLQRERGSASRQDDFVRLQAKDKGKARAGDEVFEPRLVGEDGRPRKKEVVLTDQQPGLLGGAKEEARYFLDNLTSEKRKSLKDYKSRLNHYCYKGEAHPVLKAKSEYPEGHKIDKEYRRLLERKTKSGPGESSRAATEASMRPDGHLSTGQLGLNADDRARWEKYRRGEYD